MNFSETGIRHKSGQSVPLVEKRDLCPGCLVHIEDSVELFSVDLLGVSSGVCRCGSCGLIYKDWSLTKSGLKKVYADDYVHHQNSHQGVEDRISTERRLTKILNKISAPVNCEVRLLDVGCGSGGVVSTALDLGIDAYGIDPFLPSHLESSRLTCQSVFDLKTEEWDIITAFNVIEHLVNPHSFFVELNRLLKPGGAVLFTCPWGDSIHRKLYKAAWQLLALEEHLLFWTHGSLKVSLATAGIYGDSTKTVCGAPFPIGYKKQARIDTVVENEEGNVASKEAPTEIEKRPIKKKILDIPMQMMRTAQRNKKVSAFLRTTIDIFRIGCYLEFLLVKSETGNQRLSEGASESQHRT